MYLSYCAPKLLSICCHEIVVGYCKNVASNYLILTYKTSRKLSLLSNFLLFCKIYIFQEHEMELIYNIEKEEAIRNLPFANW